MFTELELLIVFYLLFLMFFCAFEAFDRLSGGLIHKIEETDEKLAAKFTAWQENGESIRAIYKLVLFILVTMMGIFSYLVLRRVFGSGMKISGLLIVVIAVALAWTIGELFSNLVLFRFDITILKLTVPVVSLFANTILWPVTKLSEQVRRSAEEWRDETAPEQKVGAEDEILSFVENCADGTADDLEEGEKRMIKGILDLDDMSVREIMTPRVDMTALPCSASLEEAKKCFIETGHSRIPVYGRSVDEIKGIIYAKDFIDEKAIAGKTLDQLARIPVFVPESKEVGELLEEFKRLHNHFAVIIDEYGGTSGIITFEDIIEEIIGDVQDEYDNEEDEKQKPQLMPDGSIVMEARTLVSDVNEMMDSDIPESDNADTIGGVICCELGRIPEAGERFHFKDSFVTAEVVKADQRRIQTLKLFVDEESGEENSSAGR